MNLIFTSKKFEKQGVDLDAEPDELVMAVDLDRCINCGACGVACELQHGVARFIKIGSDEGEGKTATFFLPLTCRQCETRCVYYDTHNFWISCPEKEGAQAAGIFDACDLCKDRIDKGFWPACATRCSMKAIYFGQMSDIRIVLREKRFRELGDVLAPARG
jgi:Fe-S-cluster-containing dehydrogenase component